MAKQLKQWLESVEAKMPTKNQKFNAKAYSKYVQDSRTNRMQKRENQNWQFLQPGFAPSGGWWQDRGKAK